MRLIDADALIETMRADVVPVRHGRWIENKEEIVCSKCTNILDARAWYRYFSYGKPSYCPNCGAKMDEEKDDEL